MSVSLDDVKKLREITGVSMMACKKALEETNGNIEKAIEELRKRGEMKAAEKSERKTGQGVIVSYIHTNRRLGSMLHLACETDFVAENEDFISLAQDLAMQVVATNPMALNPEDIDADIIAKEKVIWLAQLQNEGKPADKIEMILVNKEKKYREENSLIKQAFIKDADKTVEKLLTDAINKIGENMKIVKYVRYSI
jgi:elongation factor Ts